MTQVNFRIDSDVKREADELFDHLGLSLSAAITIFIKRSIAYRGLPFASSCHYFVGMFGLNSRDSSAIVSGLSS